MNKRNLRLIVSIVAVAGLVPAWACSSNNDSTGPAPSSSSTNGNTGGTTSGTGGPSDSGSATSTGGGSTGTGAASGGTPIGDGGCTGTMLAASPAPVSGGVLDDMSGQQSTTGGSWYSYSARTVPNSEPPVLTVMSGTLNPLEGVSFPPTTMGGTPVAMCVPAFAYDNSGNFNYREFSGNMIPNWGAGFGFDMTDFLPDGGPVAFNMCDAGMIFDTRPDASNVGIPQPFDASAYTGFSFWGISLSGAAQTVEVHVDDAQTDPWGGKCNACLNGGKCSTPMNCPCSDNFVQTVKFQPMQWKQFVVKFSDAASFAVQNWSGEGHLVFDPKTMYNIHFQISVAAKASGPFDIAVADLVWTK